LEQLYLNGVGTQKAIDLIASYELIVPWPLIVRHGEAQETPIKGVFRIDEAKLNQLEDDQWLALRRAGAIPLIYGQLLSMGHLGKLLQILQHKTDLLANNAVAADNLNAFFGEDDDSGLNFDSI
ncbi:MAG: SapC, partial [Methylococcales bacterium]|nr:SapC [Methylococcales bacterium]